MTLAGSTAVERESSMMVLLLGHINVSYMNEELHAHVLLGLVSAVNRPLQPNKASLQASLHSKLWSTWHQGTCFTKHSIDSYTKPKA